MKAHQNKLNTFLSLLLLILLTTACGSSKKAYTSASQPSRKATTKRVSPQDQVISSARTYIGVPYKWGGTTRAGLDCSGLLVCSFKTANISLPRTSAEQAKYGRLVSIHELQPGDLVFFATGRRRGKITHVGMVTEVRDRKDVRFIHASTKLGVVENNLYSDYYRKNFIKARRPF